jgi:tetratricopeptide (TPR) repeat protein
MNWVERIARWVGVDVTQDRRPEVVNLRATLEIIRTAKRGEEYPEALAAIERAEGLTRQIGGADAPTVLGLLELHRADIYIRLRQYNEAQAMLEAIVARTPAGQSYQRAYAMVMLGMMAYQQGDLQVARERLERARDEALASKSLGAEGRALSHLAEVYLDEGNAAYAIHLLREGAEKLHRSGDYELAPYFSSRLAEAELAAGNEANCDTLLSNGIGLAQRMRSKGDLRRIHRLLSERALAKNQLTDALSQIEMALELTPVFEDEKLVLLRQAVTVYIRLGRAGEALRYARQALDISPHDDSLHSAVGQALYASGQAAEAIPYLQRAMNQPDGGDFDTARALAAAYFEAGQVEDAERAYQALLAQTGERLPEYYARALRDYGLMRTQQYRWAEAVKAWTDCLAMYKASGASNPILARLYCDIANARLAQGQAARAFRDLDEALMLVSRADDPVTRGVVLSNAAGAYVEKGDLETAEAFFTEAIQIAQRTGDHVAEATRQGNYGWFLLVTGRVTRAQTALNYAIQQSEQHGLSLQAAVQTSNLAQVAEELGHLDEAQRLHLRALSMLQPSHAPRWQALLRCNAALFALKQGGALRDDARTWLMDAAGFAPLELDAEVHYRVQIGLALADRDIDPAGTAARLGALLPAVRAVGLKRLLADALSALSVLCAAANLPDSGAHWAEAQKLYQFINSPLAQRPPAGVTAG